MRTLRYSINVTLDGCVHHEAGIVPDEEFMRFWTDDTGLAELLLFGRVTYQMMEEAWRRPTDGVWPGWMSPWEVPFAEAIDAKPKLVVSSTLASVDWNAVLLRGDPVEEIRRLKEQPGGVLSVGGVRLPLALADAGLVDEYVLVHPVVAGHGPTLLAGLRELVRLELVVRRPFASGAVAHTFRPV